MSTTSAPPGPPAVDFYILERGGQEEAQRIACRLAEKGWQQGYKVLLRVTDAAQAKVLDELLWTFRQESFVPHGLHDEDPEAAVVITHGDTPLDTAGLLINLAEDVPQRADRFRRIAEIVATTTAAKNAGRQRYRAYRAQGWPLRTHPM